MLVGQTMEPPRDLASDATVHFDLGFAYAEMGLAADAISELEAALRLEPEHRDAAKAIALLVTLKHEVR